MTPRAGPQTLFRLSTTLALATLAFGCRDDGRLPTYPVAGQVNWSDDAPFVGGADAFVVFESIEHGVTATGVVSEDGGFEVGTYEPGDGAVEGRHRVSLSPPTPGGDPDKGGRKVLLPPRYRSLETSGLEATVSAGGENRVVLILEK